MTYCVGLKLDRGLVMAADTRTNAGLDNVATFKKLHVWEKPGERVLCLLSAGNLAVTQSVVSLLSERLDSDDPSRPTLFSVETMFQAARLVAQSVPQSATVFEPTRHARRRPDARARAPVRNDRFDSLHKAPAAGVKVLKLIAVEAMDIVPGLS